MFKKFAQKGQHGLEMIIVVTLIAIGIYIGGPILIYHVNGLFKGYEDAYYDSLLDPLDNSPNTTIIDQPVDCCPDQKEYTCGASSPDGTVSCDKYSYLSVDSCNPKTCVVKYSCLRDGRCCDPWVASDWSGSLAPNGKTWAQKYQEKTGSPAPKSSGPICGQYVRDTCGVSCENNYYQVQKRCAGATGWDDKCACTRDVESTELYDDGLPKLNMDCEPHCRQHPNDFGEKPSDALPSAILHTLKCSMTGMQYQVRSRVINRKTQYSDDPAVLRGLDPNDPSQYYWTYVTEGDTTTKFGPCQIECCCSWCPHDPLEIPMPF